MVFENLFHNQNLQPHLSGSWGDSFSREEWAPSVEVDQALLAVDHDFLSTLSSQYVFLPEQEV